MTDELDSVKSGEVTRATRDTEINGIEIHKGHFIGIVDGTIVVDNADPIAATVQMTEKMVDEDSEIITVMYGSDATKDEAQAVVDQLEGSHEDDDFEFEIHDGGQPVYNFLVSVE